MKGHLLFILLTSLLGINGVDLFDFIIETNVTDSYLLSLKQVFTFNGSLYTDWSEWGKCSPERECSQIRYRECKNLSYSERGPGFMKRCNTRFIIETRTCQGDIFDECQEKIVKANERVAEMLSNCGTKEDFTKKIFGGKLSESHKAWPWNVGIYVTLQYEDYPSLPICGGTLIAPGYVLTAAHCLSDIASKLKKRRFSRSNTKWNRITDINSDIEMKVVINDYILSEDEGTELSAEVAFYMTHPIYNLISTNFDIAILKLKKPFDSAKVTTACLPRSNVKLSPNTKCYAVGWGYINNSQPKEEEEMDEDYYDYLFARLLRLWGRPQSPYRIRKQADDEDSERIRSDELREVQLPLQNLEKCENLFSNLNAAAHVCAGKKGSDTCKGDSGGGLYCQDKEMDNKWVNYGITSYGSSKGCGLHYSVYTSVAGSRDWIESVLKEDYIATISKEYEEESL